MINFGKIKDTQGNGNSLDVLMNWTDSRSAECTLHLVQLFLLPKNNDLYQLKDHGNNCYATDLRCILS